MQTGNVAARSRHALALVLVGLWLALPASDALAQSTLTVRVPPGETREARLTINSNATATLRTEPPAGITVTFDPAEGGPGSWVTMMRVSAGDGLSGEFALVVTLDSGAATPATLTVTVVVAPIPTTTTSTTTATTTTVPVATTAPPPTTSIASTTLAATTTQPAPAGTPTTLAPTTTSVGAGGPGTNFAAPGSGGPGFGVVALLAGLGLLAVGLSIAGLVALLASRFPRPHVSRVVFSSRYQASQPIGFNSPAPPPNEGTTPGDR